MQVHVSVLLLACGVLAQASSAAELPSAPRLRCEVSYAGTTHVVEADPTDDPYGAPSVDIGGRFFFKPVVVQGPQRIERISLYAYLATARQPVLVQQATYLPPYPRRDDGRPVNLTGEQHLYAGPVERELIYQCHLGGGRP